MRTLAFQFHPECDRPMCEALLNDPEHAAKAGRTAEGLKAELEEHYATYARLSDRLALNIAAFACPFQKLMVVLLGPHHGDTERHGENQWDAFQGGPFIGSGSSSFRDTALGEEEISKKALRSVFPD